MSDATLAIPQDIDAAARAAQPAAAPASSPSPSPCVPASFGSAALGCVVPSPRTP